MSMRAMGCFLEGARRVMVGLTHARFAETVGFTHPTFREPYSRHFQLRVPASAIVGLWGWVVQTVTFTSRIVSVSR